MATGKIKTLYSDKEKTEALFPRTKTSAVSDDDGVGLDALLDSKAPVGNYVEYNSVGNISANGISIGPDGIPSDGSQHGGYIDFHFNGSGMTSRIIDWHGAYGGTTTGIDFVTSRLMYNSVDLEDIFAPIVKNTLSGMLGTAGWYRVGILSDNSSTNCVAIGRLFIGGSYNAMYPRPAIIEVAFDYHRGYFGKILDYAVGTQVTKVRLCRIDESSVGVDIYYDDVGSNTVYVSVEQSLGIFTINSEFENVSNSTETIIATLDLNRVQTTRMDLLWENASPYSSFPAQTISLDLSMYDCVEVVGHVGEPPTNVFGSAKIPIGQSSSINGFGEDFWYHARNFSVTSTGITFNSGYMRSPDGTIYSNWNGRSIPYKIYGIREGQ